jgi:hypothetical protein
MEHWITVHRCKLVKCPDNFLISFVLTIHLTRHNGDKDIIYRGRDSIMGRKEKG